MTPSFDTLFNEAGQTDSTGDHRPGKDNTPTPAQILEQQQVDYYARILRQLRFFNGDQLMIDVGGWRPEIVSYAIERLNTSGHWCASTRRGWSGRGCFNRTEFLVIKARS